jgi:hypothetical protein
LKNLSSLAILAELIAEWGAAFEWRQAAIIKTLSHAEKKDKKG